MSFTQPQNMKRMISKNIIPKLGISFIFIIQILLVITEKKARLPFSYATFKTQTGWGYNILVDNKIFIHQDKIPVFEKDVSFNSENDAKKTAELILTKLKTGKQPSITSFELQDALQVK
jgi:hypothetical protein